MRLAGAKIIKILKEILKICKKPISFEVFDVITHEKTSLIINSWGNNVYVKMLVKLKRYFYG